MVVLALVLSAALPASAAQVVRIGSLSDTPWVLEPFSEPILEEVRALLTGEFEVEFTPSAQLFGDGSAEALVAVALIGAALAWFGVQRKRRARFGVREVSGFLSAE